MRVPGLGRIRRAFRRIRDAHVGAILLYHRVAEADADPWGLAVSPGHFAEHMEVLRRLGLAIRLGELTGRLGNRRTGPPSVAVTFDDGYADNLLAAVPVLERHEIPATVFVATGAIGRDREFWWDELARVVLHPRALPGTLRLTIRGTTAEWTLEDAQGYDEDTWLRFTGWQAWEPPPTARHALYLSVWERLRAVAHAEQQGALDALAAWAGLDRAARPSHRPLATAEAEVLARVPLVEIGAHTVTHPFLSALPPALQASEIRASKAQCEALVGRPVESFAYPFGNYTAETAAAVREAGFARACSTQADPVRSSARLFELPRVQVQDWDGDEFERRLPSGFRP